MAPKQVLTSPLFRIYGLGQTVSRPFKDPNTNPFAALLPKNPEEENLNEKKEVNATSPPKATSQKKQD